MTVPTQREVWSIAIREDGPEPWLEIKAEYAMRTDRGSRHVAQALHPIEVKLASIADVPCIFPDGYETTLGVLIQELREAAALVMDQSEEDGNGRAETPPPTPDFRKAMQRKNSRREIER